MVHNNETDSKKKPAPTIRRVPDDLWAEIEPLLPKPGPKQKPGRPRVPDRVARDGILLCSADRLSMEGYTQGVQFRFDLSPALLAMGQGGHRCQAVGHPGGTL